MTRPIDMQVMLPKLQMLHHAKESVVHKEANALQAAQMQGKQEAEKQQHVVKTLENKEQTPLKNDTKGDGHRESDQRRAKHASSAEESETQDEVYHEPGRGDRFDMKV